MGGGSWSSSTYNANTSAKRAAGYATSFSHHEDIESGKVVAQVHESLDPGRVAGDESPNAGKIIREAFDSEDHPNSVPIAVIFDETGSMGTIPRVLQTKLPELHGLVLHKGYVEDPQFLFGAVGDAVNREVAPLQIGQFEADNRGDEQLENIFLEHNGGGGNHESYALAAYYLAYHTDLDSVKKRGKKGYVYLIGDERLYDVVTEEEVRTYIGEDAAVAFRQRFEGPTAPTEQIFRDLQDLFEVFFIFAAQAMYQPEMVLPEDAAQNGGTYGHAAIGWRSVLPEDRILILQEGDAVCEVIALSLGVMEGTIDISDGLQDLKELGAGDSVIASASKALASVGAGAGSGGAAVATVEGDEGDLGLSDEPGAERI
jgi:hypothetical protein